MLLKTTRFGEVEINEDYVFVFVEPIIGYEAYKKFALIDHNEKSPFKWLQSVENPGLALPITLPSYFGIDYKFVIPDDKEKLLCITNPENVLCLTIANVPNGAPQNTTINLLAPIVVNVENKYAMQLVLTDTNYGIKHRLFVKEGTSC